MKKITGNLQRLIPILIFAALLLTCAAGPLCVSAEAEDRNLIVPDADARYYTEGEISDMPLQVLNYAKNEIYARHGRLFDSAELAGYFSLQPWYSGSVRAADFTDKVFNEYELANIFLLSEREMSLREGGYPLDQPGYTYDAVEDYIAARLGTIREEAFLMRLRKIIGTVFLKDSGGEDLDVEENMRLFSESELGTQTESGAIVDLDEEKLAILDELSRAALEKNEDGSRLVIRLKKGGLYFSVDEPLGEKESFDITFSDLRLAIRGTSGVVSIEDRQNASVILSSGHAMIYEEGTEAGTAQGTEIQAGERVRISSDTEGRKTYERETLSEEELPPFLTECLRQDPDAVPEVLAATGWTGESFAGSTGDDLPRQDGDRIVFRGTLNEYTYEETAAMWNAEMGGNYPLSDYERELHPTYLLITLDEPQTMEVMAGGGPELVSQEISVLGVEDRDDLAQYAGQNLVFSVNPHMIHNPSDISLPAAPRVSDIYVLNE